MSRKKNERFLSAMPRKKNRKRKNDLILLKIIKKYQDYQDS